MVRTTLPNAWPGFTHSRVCRDMTGGRIIAIDIGGTQLRLALFENNAILAREAVPTDVTGGPSGVMDQIDMLVDRLCPAGARAEIRGIGLSLAALTEAGCAIRGDSASCELIAGATPATMPSGSRSCSSSWSARSLPSRCRPLGRNTGRGPAVPVSLQRTQSLPRREARRRQGMHAAPPNRERSAAGRR